MIYIIVIIQSLDMGNQNDSVSRDMLINVTN